MKTIEALIPEPADYIKTEDGVEPLWERSQFIAFAALVAEECAKAIESVDAGGCSDPREFVKAIRAAFPMPKP